MIIRQQPARNPQCQKHKSQNQNHLPHHIHPIPNRTVRHLLPVHIPHRFCQCPTRTNPPAISPLAPAPDNQRNHHKSLHQTNAQPPPQRLTRKHIPEKQGPRQNKAQTAPVLPPVCIPLRRREQRICHRLQKSTIGKPTIVTQPRQENVRQQKQGHTLNNHQRHRLHRHIRRLPSINPANPKPHHTRTISQRIIKTRLRHRRPHRSEKTRLILCRRQIKRKQLCPLKPLVNRNPRTRLPVIHKHTRQHNQPKRHPRTQTPFPSNRHTRPPEKIQRRLAPNHRKHRIIGQCLITCTRRKHHLILTNRLHLTRQRHSQVFPTRKHLNLLHILGLGTAQFRAPIRQRHPPTGLGNCNRRLQRTIAATDHEHILVRIILWIVQPVHHLIQILARHI